MRNQLVARTGRWGKEIGRNKTLKLQRRNRNEEKLEEEVKGSYMNTL